MMPTVRDMSRGKQPTKMKEESEEEEEEW